MTLFKARIPLSLMTTNTYIWVTLFNEFVN